MKLEAYRALHFLGLFWLFLALGSMMMAAAAAESARNPLRKVAGMSHGIALLLLAVSGFGMLSTLGLGMPTWALLKLGIWLAFGMIVIVLRRRPQWIPALWVVLPLLAVAAQYLAHEKPE